ncbi:SCP2 sterol-binding domain-containing protein [Phaeacidiphilus oryzae]|uniref:SCP2 sterol-binding domain-containing protein n=1 Tax=Phaeacidiphilus oryzae TaxID=348818 RepID=UPI00056C83C3|nr:SCP2 sterol-binding domain-containing protein [Phaeacidiphilus oryzae]
MTTATALRFLSEAYLAELAGLPPQRGRPVPGVGARVGFRVPDAPEGPAEFSLLVEEGLVAGTARGLPAGADLEITAAYRDLAEFQEGSLHAATAFVTGRFAVTGDKAKLLDLMVVLQSGRYHEHTADLWARTTL